MTDPSLAYIAGDGGPPGHKAPSAAMVHVVAFDLFVLAILAVVVWWMALRDEELVRLRRDVDAIRATMTVGVE